MLTQIDRVLRSDPNHSFMENVRSGYRPTHRMRIMVLENLGFSLNQANSDASGRRNLCKRKGLTTHPMLFAAGATVNIAVNE